MDSPRERACPRCGASAGGRQRWCLECGHELSGARRTGLRPVVGIATTLAVLVGAASAGGYTLLRDGKQPPPPAQTVAVAPPATTAPETMPPATQEPATPAPLPRVRAGSGFSSRSAGGTSSFGGGPSPSTPSSSFPSGGSGGTTTSGGGTGSSSGSSGKNGSLAEDPGASTGTTASKPRFALTNIALGATAVVYAPYTAADVDLGDPSRTVDGSTRTVWKVPVQADPTASPQVGVYIDLAGRERVRKLVLETPTPGMTVEIYGATRGPPDSITDPGWDHVASRSGIGAKATFKLHDRTFRYVLVWITEAPPDGQRAAISELSLYSLQPE